MKFTRFPDLAAHTMDRVELTFEALVSWIQTQPIYPTKAACPLVSFATYGDICSTKGSLRHDGNILDATGAVGDYDAGVVTPEEAEAMLSLVGVRALIVTTASHGVKGNRWRLLAPFSAPCTPGRKQALLMHLNELLGGILAGESFTASQSFYVGRVAGVAYDVRVVAGAMCLDELPGTESLPEVAAARMPAGAVDEFAMVPKRASGGLPQIKAALALIPREPTRDGWLRVGMAVYTASSGDDEGLAAWRDWSDDAAYDDADVRWSSFHASPPNSIGMPTLMSMATGGGKAVAAAMRAALPALGDAPGTVLTEWTPLAAPPDGKGTTTLEAAILIESGLDVCFDEFKQTIVLLSAPPWRPGLANLPRAWTDGDTLELQAWLSINYHKLAKEAAYDAVTLIANRHPTNPLKNYLRGLQWDGVPRLDGWLVRYLNTPRSEYAAIVGRKFLLSAVARGLDPGCKVDHVLVLEGVQGLYKSTAAKALVPDASWFVDELPDVTNKDSAIQLHGEWIVEIAEMDAMSKAEASAVKKFITRAVDVYRPPYGRGTIQVPRSCVFIGTINPEGVGYLDDQTGARRFWPVACDVCDLDGLLEARDQLWAEAVSAYDSGEHWWLDRAEEKRVLAPEQESRRSADPWEETLANWSEGSPEVDAVTCVWLLSAVLAQPKERHVTAMTKRVGNALLRLGWVKAKTRQRVPEVAPAPSVIFLRHADDPRNY